jgi:hypothetical protein
MTREELVQQQVKEIKIEMQLCRLRKLAITTAATYLAVQQTLVRELDRLIIADDQDGAAR